MQRTALIFIGAPVALLMVALLVLVIALAVSGDLEPVKAQARADGLQTDWSDPMWAVDADHAAALAELEALVTGTVFHTENHQFSWSYVDEASKHNISLRQPGSEIPPVLSLHYGADFPPWADAFTVWRQRYIARPFRLVHPSERVAWQTTRSLTSMMDWLSYRVLVGEMVTAYEVLELLDANDLVAFDHHWQATRRWQMLDRIATIIHLRQEHWRDSINMLIAALQTRREQMAVEYRQVLRGQFIAISELVGRDPHKAAIDYGIAVPVWFEIPTVAPIVHQLGRVAVLDRHRALTVDLLNSADFMSKQLRFPSGEIIGRRQLHGWHPAGLIESVFHFDEIAWVMWMIYHRSSLMLELTIADLTGKPWPRDPMDPAGGLLTPWLEHGALVGAFSVGPDRLIGTSDDWRLRLRDPPPPPTAAPSPPTAAPAPHPAP